MPLPVISNRRQGHFRHTSTSPYKSPICESAMTEPEKMEALKRAYAEMILNTAKEAAARVMAAELRARRLERDVVRTKDEAARMLVCLKQTIDAKTEEAEIASLNRQRKCDELESQLNEAEGVIIDLRAELDRAHERLDEAKNKNLSSTKQNDNTCLEENNHVLDQLKEPELLRNGCTHRICATETNAVQEKFVAGEKLNPSTNSTNVQIASDVSASELEEKVGHGENEEEAVSIVRRSVRKRKLKSLGDFISASRLRKSYQYKKPRDKGVTLLKCCKTSNAKSRVKSCEDRFGTEDGTQSETRT